MLKLPVRTSWWKFALISVLSVALAVWMVVTQPLDGKLLGAAVLIVFPLIWMIGFAVRRPERAWVVADEKRLSLPGGSVAWDDIDRIWIARTMRQRRAPRALYISARSGSVTVPDSRVLRLARRVNVTAGEPDLAVLEGSVELPLVELVTEFERLAGRKLTPYERIVLGQRAT